MEDSPSRVLEAYIAGTRAVRSYDVTVTVENSTVLEAEAEAVGGPLDPPQRPTWRKLTTPHTSIRVSRQRFLDGLFRIDMARIDDRVFEDETFLSSWDGEFSKKLTLHDMSGSVQGFARSQNGPALLSYQDLFLVFDGDYTFAAFMQDRELSCELVDSLYMLTAHPSAGSSIRASRFGLKLYLDPARSFMPVRGAYTIQGHSLPQCEWVNELFEPEPGVWVPKSGTVDVIYWEDPESPFVGTPIGSKTLTLDPERSRFNLDLDPDLFTISFPPGLTIRDDVSKAEYVSGPDGTATHLRSLVEPARLVMGEYDQGVESRSRTLLVVINIVVGAVVLVYFVYYRARRAT